MSDKRLLLNQIIDCAECVLNELGPTHSEQTYQNALEIEFQERKILYQRQPTLTIYYKKKAVGFHRPDLIVGDNIVVELKSRKTEKNEIGDIWESQINQYVKCLNYGPLRHETFIGVLIVFNLSGNLSIRYSNNIIEENIISKSLSSQPSPPSPYTTLKKRKSSFENCIDINLPDTNESNISFTNIKL
jgi:GxxExxY protein